MKKCPNISSPEWKELVGKIGVFEAMKEFIKYDGIPNASNYSENFKGVNASLKIFSALTNPKTQSLYDRFFKSNPEKFYQELSQLAGKQQVQLLKEWNSSNTSESLNDMIIGVLAENSYSLEINVPTENQYSRQELSVPGGTNYIINTVNTPTINVLINRHPDFTNDNTIGWIRNDEEQANPGTRRILEMQSDVFQDREASLVATVDSANTFLKNLTKDNNWVTLFVKSVIQDSAKKGYNSILFPLGDTISRIQQHETSDIVISRLEQQLAKLDQDISEGKFKDDLYSYSKGPNGLYIMDGILINEETYNKKTATLREEYAKRREDLVNKIENTRNLKPGTMRSIFELYQHTITNILNKQYGKENITIYTDEYGNSWNQLNIKPEYGTDTIFFEPQREAERNFEVVNGMAFSEDLKDKLRAGKQQITIRDRFHNQGTYNTTIGQIQVNPVAQQRVKLEYFAEEGETLQEVSQRLKDRFKGNDELNEQHIKDFFENKSPMFVYNMNLILPESLFYQPSNEVIDDPFSLPVGKLVAYKALKQQMLNRTERQILVLNRQSRELNPGVSKERTELNNKREKLNDLVSELEKEIAQLNDKLAKSTTILAPLVERDLERAQLLSQSSDPAAISEATEITNFISAFPKLVSTDIERFHYGEHPIYTSEEIEKGIPEDEQEILREWAVRADAIRDTIARNNKEILVQTANNTAGVDKLYNNKLTIEDLKRPLKDTDWVSMYVMDISNGIFSTNGLLPQVAQSVFTSEMEYAQAKYRILAQRIDSLTPRVEQAMKEMEKLYPGKFTKNNFFKNKSIPDYSIFFQQDENGMFGKGAALVDVFSSEYWSDKRQMNSEFNRALTQARDIADPRIQADRMRMAYEQKFKWIRNNEHIFDPRKISSLRNDPELSAYKSLFDTISDEESKAHEDLLRNLLGERQFNERVKTLKQYAIDFIEMRENFIQQEMEANNIWETHNLPESSKLKIERFEQENSPFVLARVLSTGTFPMRETIYGMKPIYPKSISAYISIPKDSKHYDQNYKLIHSNDTLSEFYNIAREISETMKGVFPPEIQNKLLDTSLHYLPRTSMEILMSQNGTFFGRLWDVIRKMFRDLLGIIGVDAQSEMTYAHIDYISGQANYEVNNSFFTKNLRKIQAIYNLEANKFMTLTKISKNLRALDPNTINQAGKDYLSTILGSGVEDYLKQDRVDIVKLISAYAHHQMAENSSMNLPKVLKTYANLATQYEARTNVLPLMNNLKNHYEEIKNTALNNVGEDTTNAQVGMMNNTGNRTRAISQFESWFNRNILDNKGVTEHQGTIKKEYETTRVNKLAKRLGRVFNGRFGKVYSFDEKNMIKDIKQFLETQPKELVDKITEIIRSGNRSEESLKILEANQALADIIRTLEESGKFISASSTLRGVQKFLVAKMLGLNLSSAITNFIEGQISNGLQATLSDTFPSQYINDVTPIDLIYANTIGRIKGKDSMPEKIWILNKLIERYDLFNDISQEIQKSSTESLFDSFVSNILMSPTRKTEYLNQAPLIAAIMRDTIVEGKEGMKSEGLLDIFKRVNIGTEEQPLYELGLKDEYNTPDNQGAWLRENLNTKTQKVYQELKQRIDQTIKNAHGDYNKFTGMKAKDSAIGQAFVTLRTWLPRQLYIRFAPEQDDILLGVKGFKGFVRSHTSATALTIGALAGLMTGGAGVAVLGAGLAYGANQIGLLGGGKWGAKSGAGFLQELSIMSQVLFKKMIGMPVNSLTRLTKFIHGKSRLIDTNSNLVYALKDGKITQADIQNILTSSSFTERDFRNFKANLQDIANILMMYGLFFATKALLWDDDDDNDDPERQWHNMMANRSMQLVGQATTYYNAYELFQQVNPNNTAVYKFLFQDLPKFAKDAATPGAVQTYGENSGENKAWTSFQKAFIPNILGDPYSLGFDKQMKRQFTKSPLDKLFWGEEKNAKEEVREIRAEDKARMIKNGLSKEEANKAIREKYGSKEKEESYIDYLNRIANIKANSNEEEQE